MITEPELTAIERRAIDLWREDSPGNEILDKDVPALVAEVRRLQAGGWIDGFERLPTYWTDVLIADKRGIVTVAQLESGGVFWRVLGGGAWPCENVPFWQTTTRASGRTPNESRRSG